MHIYVITNEINGKKYVGKTKCEVSKRWRKHLDNARKGVNGYLYRAMSKHGTSNFTIETVETLLTVDELQRAEKRWISQLQTSNPEIGYNLAAGHDDVSSAATEKVIHKVRGTLRKVINQTTRDAVSRVHKGRPKSVEQRRKTAAHWDEDRREVQAEIARRINAVENLKLKDYECDLCGAIFIQVKKVAWGGHRKACMHKHNAFPPTRAPLYDYDSL